MSLFGVSVLMIEDDEATARAVQAILEDGQPRGWNIKYRLKTIGSLTQAKRVIKTIGYDIILLDLKLPDSEGIATFRACFELAKAPIIVLSGSADLPMVLELLREGAKDCFDKHTIASCLDLLHHAIIGAIERYRLKSENERLQGTLLEELRNLITACSNCHRWRNSASNKYMSPVDLLEKYGVFLSHGICPDCAKLLYSDQLGPE